MSQILKADFYSSVEEGLFQKSLRRELERSGVSSDMIYGVALDKYRTVTGIIPRSFMRTQMYFGYTAKCAYRWTTNSEGSVSVVATNPFYLPYIASTLIRSKSSKIINLVWDLFPDALVEGNLIRADSLVARLLGRMTQRSIEKCDATIFLGDYLKSYAESMYGMARKAVVIPVGADGEPFANNPPKINELNRELCILYSGNMGRMHDSITISEALCTLSQSNVHLKMKFYGYGDGITQVEKNVAGIRGNISVEFGSGFNDEQWISMMKNASIALVTIKSGAERVVMPSKTYSSMMAGQAILGVCSCKSDLADLIFKYNCGWVIEPGRSDDLADLLINLAKNPNLVYEKRINAYAAGHGFFSSKVLAKDWLNLFNDL